MNLNKKAIFGIAAGLFAVATVFNMSLLNDNGAGDVSLEAVALMAQAQWEGPWGNGPYVCTFTPDFGVCAWYHSLILPCHNSCE